MKDETIVELVKLNTRDRFACAALHALMRIYSFRRKDVDQHADEVAQSAFAIADAMMRAREK